MKLLTIEQVCEILSVGRDKLRQLEKSGQVPKPILVGRTKRWEAAELEAFLKEQVVENG
jgi:excisionase family DNA binding protein